MSGQILNFEEIFAEFESMTLSGKKTKDFTKKYGYQIDEIFCGAAKLREKINVEELIGANKPTYAIKTQAVSGYEIAIRQHMVDFRARKNIEEIKKKAEEKAAEHMDVMCFLTEKVHSVEEEKKQILRLWARYHQ